MVAEMRRRPSGGARHPQAQSKLGRGASPPFLLSFFPFLPPPSWTRKGGKPTPSRSRNPPWGAPHEAGPPPPPLLYIRGRGHPIDTQVDSCLSRGWCPPP